MSKIKVLIISHIYALPFNLRKIQTLAQHADLEIEVVTANSWDDRPLRKVFFQEMPGLDFSVHPLDIGFSGRHLWHFYAPLPLLKIARRFKPDIIHIEEEPGSAALWQAIVLKRALGGKLLGFTWENILRSRSPLVTASEKSSLGRLDALIAGNAEAKEVVRHKGFEGEIVVLPQFGVDMNVFSPRRNDELRARLGLKRLTVGFMGRLEERKGVLTLVEAAANSGVECDLLFVGSGPAKDRIIERSRQMGCIANLVFVDTVPGDEVAAYFNCMDVLVLPSITRPHWKEQFGRVLVEAMACGIPVLGSDSGAIPEVIGNAGMVFHQGDATELRTLLQKLATDVQLRAELAQRGRKRVEELYTEQRIAERTREIYLRLVSG